MKEEAQTTGGMRQLQEADYGAGTDYRRGSPHLKHQSLAGLLESTLRSAVRDVRDRGLALDALEIGAGHGTISTALLALGCTVTASEMSRGSLAVLQARFRDEPRFRAVHDADGSLAVLEAGTDFSFIAYVSVLHHIPDYLAAIEANFARLRPGGALLSFADPLWYPRQSRLSRLANRGGYYAWRLAQGGHRRGLATLWRRARGELDETNPSDMVEYHVVRSGVDEAAIEALLRPRFESVRVIRYWSQNAAWAQSLGTRIGLQSAFGIIALGHRG